MAFDTHFLDELRQRTPLTSLIGRRHKLTRSGRNWKTCCPFHGEKSPSFYIYDDHFHCFGCGVHGDAISFVMQSDGSSFPEAVEKLASEAGMEIPKDDPQQEEKARERQSLYDVLARVQELYRQNLYTAEGREGLAYLTRRGLREETLERFGLGWSGDGRSLVAALRADGITVEQLAQVGLMRLDEVGHPRGELFFNRVTFPIRDRKGRVISFGGRILGDGQPKYLNGPETPLFSKRRTLFNLDHATQAVRKGAELVVVEGYMDAIALDQAGLQGAVAPLGTALGEEQLELLWHLTPRPIICLDGDQAGQRAALRVCEVALPLLSAEKSLSFCRLSEGDDPDSFVQREGAMAMAERFAQARPMVEELFNLLSVREVNPGPEQRAALRERLIALSRQIPERNLASEYRSTFLDLFFERFRRHKGKRGARSPGRISTGPREPRSVAEGAVERLNVLTVLIVCHPAILPHIEQAYTQLMLPDTLNDVREAVLEWADQSEELTAENCQKWMQEHGLGEVLSSLIDGPLPRTLRSARSDDDMLKVDVLESWWHFYALVNFASFEREVQQSVEDVLMAAYSKSSDSSEGERFPVSILARMKVVEALKRGEQPELDEGTDAPP